MRRRVKQNPGILAKVFLNSICAITDELALFAA